MAKIEKKVWCEYFDQVASGKKKYELRLNDFEIEEGDVLVLREWDKVKKVYTGRVTERAVTRVNRFALDDFYEMWPKEEIEKRGIQIISLE